MAKITTETIAPAVAKPGRKEEERKEKNKEETMGQPLLCPGVSETVHHFI